MGVEREAADGHAVSHQVGQASGNGLWDLIFEISDEPARREGRGGLDERVLRYLSSLPQQRRSLGEYQRVGDPVLRLEVARDGVNCIRNQNTDYDLLKCFPSNLPGYMA